MADPKGFLKIKRKPAKIRPVPQRIRDFKEIIQPRSYRHSKQQASRCMDCGTPFCHWGCPIGNYIPEWNDLLFHADYKRAFELLEATNNLPEITGRICPAYCEDSCVLGINDEPVTIRENELAIVEYAFRKGLIKAKPPRKRTSKKIAIIGSGPSGISCADQLNKAGHKVVVFERDAKVGGILRYGIPDFKLEKWILERRIKLLEKEGIEFRTGVSVGKNLSSSKLLNKFDAASLAIGSRVPRDLNIKGRDLKGIYFALDYLSCSNKRVAGEEVAFSNFIDAKNKKVVVIGGGDTGADCVGVANRQGAKCVTQIELLPKPPEHRTEDYPWPYHPIILKTSAAHEEGCQRKWSVLTKRFIGQDGKIKKLLCTQVDFSNKDANGRLEMKEIANSEFEIEADLVIIAVGFLHPEHKGLISNLSLKLDKRGNIETDENYMTSRKGVFSAGDARRGQSLIVWAISEGRRSAHYIDKYLMGETHLPSI